MSKCVVHMQKMKMSAMGGIQSHNQRERESSKNKEIDYEKSIYNYDLVNSENLNYARAVKERIAELNLPKAVRKDAVVYCSFIISSDRDFFDCLEMDAFNQYKTEEYSECGFLEHEQKLDGLELDASKPFFQKALNFFQERYGAENVINATVHMDEHTPHMHIGIVPVTSDGKLSAKQLFTKQSLRELQTDFAETVGKEFGLERGTEGSKARHLDEVTYKLAKREEQLEEAEISLHLTNEKFLDLSDELERLKSEISANERYKSALEYRIMPLKDKIERLEDKLERLQAEPQLLMEEFVQHPSVKPTFDNYCLTARRRQQQEREERENAHKMGWDYWKKRMEQLSAEQNQHENDIPRNNDYER